MCEISKKIKARRQELGLTLEDVARSVGVGRSTVLRWERGEIKNMGSNRVNRMAEVLQMNPLDLVTDAGSNLPWEEAASKAEAFDTFLSGEDHDLLEALHQNPRLRLLFDRSRKMKPEDVETMLAVTASILKERDGE